jgi:hypothetical protein
MQRSRDLTVGKCACIACLSVNEARLTPSRRTDTCCPRLAERDIDEELNPQRERGLSSEVDPEQ